MSDPEATCRGWGLRQQIRYAYFEWLSDVAAPSPQVGPAKLAYLSAETAHDVCITAFLALFRDIQQMPHVAIGFPALSLEVFKSLAELRPQTMPYVADLATRLKLEYRAAAKAVETAGAEQAEREADAPPSTAPATTDAAANEPPADAIPAGPAEGQRFAWKGAYHGIAGDKRWGVIDALWRAGERGLTLDALHDEVWGDIGPADPARVAKKVHETKRRAEIELAKVDPGFEIEHRASVFVLRRPVAEPKPREAKPHAASGTAAPPAARQAG